jgi:four helix bundle protein
METETSTAGFESLLVWQKSHQFVLDIYQMTQHFPECEKFGLTSQFRRAAVSIPANIAERYGKRSSADKARFFNIAQGSLNECRYYLRLAADLGYAKTEQHFKQIDEIGRMLHSYTKKVLSSAK